MKILKYMTMLAAAAGMASACQELDKAMTYSPEEVVAPVLHDLPESVVITSDNMGESMTFTWDAADFGVKAQVNYAIEASFGADTLVLITGLSGTSSVQTYEIINSALVLSAEDGGLGVPADTPSDVNFYVSATIGDTFGKYYSEPATVKMTVTEAERTYPMVYVIGDFCGWADGQTQELFSFSGDEVTYSGVIGFNGMASNGFKIKGTETGWSDDCNWGLDSGAEAPEPEATSIQLITSGGSSNISNVYSHEYYRFTFDRSSLVLTTDLSFDQIGAIGDFNGWGEDLVLNFDTETQRFWADIEFPAEGGFKIRKDADWGVSWGAADGSVAATEGVFDGGNNITAPAGNYRLYVNFNDPANMTWELVAEDYGL